MKRLLTSACLSLLLCLALVSCAPQIKAVNGKKISEADMDAFLAHQMDSIKLPGLAIAIINDGKIVYHRELGYADLEAKIPVDANTMFEAASMSKTVFAYFVMKMVDKGVIDLDTPLYTYLPNPDIAYDERYKLITARMVLSHTTGLPNWREWDPADPALNIKKGDLYLKFTPGTGFSYSGEAYQYLVKVMEHLLKTDDKGMSDMVYKEVNVPMGMEHAAFYWNNYIKGHKAKGYRQENANGINKEGTLKKFDDFSAAGGCRTSALDYARFLIGMIDGKGLSNKMHNEMLSANSKLTDPDMILDNGGNWGLGLAIKDTPNGKRYLHSGHNGDFTAYYIMYKDTKRGFVFLTNCNRAGDLFENLEPFFTEGNKK